jgi:hypothetical protein
VAVDEQRKQRINEPIAILFAVIDVVDGLTEYSLLV